MSDSGVVFCTVCSRLKSEDAGLIPAIERYRGSHISKVAGYAAENESPFFILSGVYGFISAGELIPPHDHVLVTQEIPVLMFKVYGQLRHLDLKGIKYYTKKKGDWAPYNEALKLAAESLAITLYSEELSETD